MNKFEELQSTILTGTQFIKSYPMLNSINITPSEKEFIELVLSYQNNGQEFFMEYSDIAACKLLDVSFILVYSFFKCSFFVHCVLY